MNLKETFLLTVVLCYAAVGEECPKGKGNISEIMKLAQEFAKIFEQVCKRTNNLVPDAVVNQTTNCFETHIKPCMKIKAPIIMDVMKDCIDDKGFFRGDKFCDSKSQEGVMSCGKKWFETKKGKLVKAFTPNMGLICDKGKLFKNCLNDNAMKVLDQLSPAN